MSLADNAAVMIAERGRTLTLRRAGAANIDVVAKRGPQANDEIAGTMDDMATTLIISNDEIAASASPTRYPRKGDTIGGYVIEDCDTRYDGEDIAMHVLSVGGSG